MTTLQSIYEQLLKASLHEHSEEEVARILEENRQFDQLDCLLHPENYAPVWVENTCNCTEKTCTKRCLFNAIQIEGGVVTIDPDKCVGCEACIGDCDAKILSTSKDLIAMSLAIQKHQGPIYAMVAPAIEGQFGDGVTTGNIRSALKDLGFSGLVEVALFADILTLKEAMEFDHKIVHEHDYQLTSCCCPMWIAMLRKYYEQLMPHVPAAVSPMVAAARTIKALYPGALTVFIGPCIAKKAEAKEKDLVGAVDYVLTFQELADLFAAAAIDPATYESDEKEHASKAGIKYAHTGGVSEAVVKTVQKINPHRAIEIKTQVAEGVPACKALIEQIVAGDITANFYEGMGCVGGCVGGPKIRIPKEAGREQVEAYAKRVAHETPIENPYVIELCNRLGLENVEDLLERSDIFTRTL